MHEDQAAFMTACGQTTGTFAPDQVRLYAKLVDEEAHEVHDAMQELERVLKFNQDTFSNALSLKAPVADLAKEAVDVIYVAFGLLHSLGVDPVAAWEEVHGSNLTKICPDTGTVLKDGFGKVIKPAHYQPANMLQVIRTTWEAK